MSHVLSRALFVLLLGATAAACGASADPAATLADADPDASSDARIERDAPIDPPDLGTCPATPPVGGGACGPDVAGGVVCRTPARCHACDPVRHRSWLQQEDCTCRSGRWECHAIAVDCFSPATLGTYVDSECTIPYDPADAGPDAREVGGDADAGDDGG